MGKKISLLKEGMIIIIKILQKKQIILNLNIIGIIMKNIFSILPININVQKKLRIYIKKIILNIIKKDIKAYINKILEAKNYLIEKHQKN